jgi:RNA polymerase sigma-70 factor, ECF subfamily
LARELAGRRWMEARGHDDPGTEAALLKKERVDAIRQAIDLLPRAQRQVMELTFLEELTAREIAQRTAQPLGTVQGRIRLGLHTLRRPIGRGR